ncbi:MAG: winged helix DNA-binding domain-containing protein [Hamadaea sp.]|nr:winged helix DNA-binding domain-containing protein [Hamadaea sp.]NUR51240.1 winged helix DNA-binding domain-containing protein [Hamadaea sp.]NUT07912.1 winged helix DNA-binding domain-containing protein [Hamadaea sp.]
MDEREIVERRLRNQRLTGEPLADPVAVVRRLGAVQAQEYAVAKWSVAQRSSGVDEAAMQAAVDSGRIVRVHALRPTWHFVAAEDLVWLQAVTAPRVHQLNAYYYRQLGVDEATTAQTRPLIQDILGGGNHLTRPELGRALAAAGIADPTGNRLAYLVIDAELEGIVCNGPMRGKQHTYALVSERVPATPGRSADDGLAELTRRYFTGHGPATVKDFAWWSSLPAARIRRGLDLAGADLSSVTCDGTTYWYAPADESSPVPSPQAHALQVYDEYVVAYSESRRLAGFGANLVVHPLILDGRLIGSWRRTASAKQLTASLSLTVSLTGRQRAAVDEAFQRYAAYAGVPVVLA